MRSRFLLIETLRCSGVSFDEADSIKSPTQSLETVSVTLVKVPVNPELNDLVVFDEDLFVGKDGGPLVSGVIPEERRFSSSGGEVKSVGRERCPDLCHTSPRSYVIPHVVEKVVTVWAAFFFVLGFCTLVWFFGWAAGLLCSDCTLWALVFYNKIK